jgi:ATP-dependent exoDNAse (exonuclease V) beta subunit
MGELFAFPLNTDPIERTRSTLPPDWSEREQALDVTRSWIVEAPAGSGKTGLLIQRYLKLLALPGVEQPEQVLAITFTLKATGEIRERVIAQLAHASQNDDSLDDFARLTRTLARAVLERDRALGWNLLDHPRRLNVRTIDSVCAEIARGLPVLSGGSGLSPVEDASSLYQLAAERTLMQLGGDDRPLSEAIRLILLHRDGNLTQLRNLLADMLALRDQWGRLVPLDHKLLEEAYLDGIILPQIERALRDGISAELKALRDIVPADLLHDLCMLGGELGYNEGYRDQTSPIAFCAGIYDPFVEVANDLKYWRGLIHLLLTKSEKWRTGLGSHHLGFVIEKHQQARLLGILTQLQGRDDLLAAFKRVNALPPSIYPPEQWKVAKALFRVLYRALAELQIVFAEREECDFTEPGLLARTALRRDDAALETALCTKIQHLLVDEMQDTSTSQYELIELLAQGWDGHSQTVFLVGDPKQSIYLFRQARVERFIRTMQRQELGDLELGCLRLTANFRSQRDLVKSFNDDFSQLFPREVNEDRPEEAPYVSAEAARGPSINDGKSAVWHPQILPSGLSSEDKRSSQRRQSKIEAAEVRKVIEEWRARPHPNGQQTHWKIAVLVRNRVHLADIVVELKRDHGAGSIPFRAVNIESLDERPEVLDLFALTRALLHPADRVAWLAVLRAPWCGLELAELHALAGADDPAFAERTLEELLAERGQALKKESCIRLQRLWTTLRAAAAQHSRLPLAEWVERTWRSLGGDVYLTPEEKTNTKRYFELLDTLEQNAGAVDMAQLRKRLNSLYAQFPSTSDAIDLITIHGAKGLEWDVVLVPGLAKKSRNSSGRLLTWNEVAAPTENAAPVLLAPIVGKGHESEALYDWLNRIQREREYAECRRLFYVACTRAREELHLFAAPAEKTDGSISLLSGSLLQAAWPAAERHFVNTQLSSKPLTAPIVMMPSTSHAKFVLPELAAESNEVTPTLLHRLPAGFRPRQNPAPIARSSYSEPPASARSGFERPEGSFEARAFGSAVHAFLEVLAGRLATGATAQSLLVEIPSWGPRISAVLRSGGLSTLAVRRYLPQVQLALQAALQDPVGLWLLGQQHSAASEHSLTSWDEVRSNVRLDRIFRAGPEPHAPGSDYLWIVDYKTTQHTGVAVDQFLSREKDKYEPQMRAYTRAMRESTNIAQIRLALYYPMLPRLIWWEIKPD